MARKPKGLWKANQFDWDRITTLSEAECCFSLSQQEVAIILTYTEMIGWVRRWYSETGADVDFSVIETFKNQLEYKLMSGCCPDDGTIYRYTSEGIYESSTDGGDTWTPDPDADPRNDWVSAPPLPGSDGEAKKCAAADNVRDQFHIWADNLVELLEAGTLITAIAAAIVGFIASVVFVSGVGAAWGVLLFSFAAALFAEGSGDFDDAMTSTVYDQFRCILFCNMQEDGTFTEENIVAILGEITTTFDGIVEAFFYSIVSTMRGTGMSNTATLGSATAEDCGDCDCPSECNDPGFILNGSVVDIGEGYIEIMATNSDYLGRPGNFITFGATDVGDYCCIPCLIDTSNATINGAGRVYCNGVAQGFAPVAGDSYLRMEWGTDNVTDTIRIVFSGSEECP